MWQVDEGLQTTDQLIGSLCYQSDPRLCLLTSLVPGFDPNTALKSGWTALMYACDHGDERIVELLLNRGANPNTQKGKVYACTSKMGHSHLFFSSLYHPSSLVSCPDPLARSGVLSNFSCHMGWCSYPI